MKTATDHELTQKMLANLAVVLVRPKYPENIGAAARVAMNMGVSQLIVVSDHEPEREKMLKLATHKATPLIDNLALCRELDQALAPFSRVVATTARQGRQRRTESSPRHVAARLLPWLANNRVALLFGPEDQGLTNDELKYCQLTITIPTADFSSLNLAQAVAIICHEFFWAVTHQGQPTSFAPKMASNFEMEGMYAHVQELLQKIGMLQTNDPSYWMANIRQLLGRMELRAKETRIIRKFCKQFLWYENREKEDGGK